MAALGATLNTAIYSGSTTLGQTLNTASWAGGGTLGVASNAATYVGGGAAAFPSRMNVSGGYLVDEASVDFGVLKGMNVHVAATVGGETFVWSQANYDAMAAKGCTIVRHVMHWDVFEQSAGVMHATAFSSLDTAIARAKAAGMYTVLDCPHLNVGRLPAWAETEANEWLDLQVHGQTLIEYTANRYKDEKAVVGLNANEPPVITAASHLTGYQTIIPWYRDIATMWPLWIQPAAYGGGTPYPNNNDDINVASYLALDTNNRGIVAEMHDYLNVTGTASSDGYQSNGSIDPLQQIGGGSQYHGWGGNYTYPNTAASRADLAAHLVPWTTLKSNGSNRVALAMGEWGIDNTGNESAYGTDKVTAFRNAGFCVEIWWNYDINTGSFFARPSSVWRAAVDSWFANATVRA